MRLAVSIFVITMSPQLVFGHGGGLNSSGCHNNRKTGGYHCHRGGSYTPPAIRGSTTIKSLPSRPSREAFLEYGAVCNEICRQPKEALPKAHALCSCLERENRDE